MHCVAILRGLHWDGEHTSRIERHFSGVHISKAVSSSFVQAAEGEGPEGDGSESDSEEAPKKKKKRRKGEKGGGVTKKQSHKDASFFADLL